MICILVASTHKSSNTTNFFGSHKIWPKHVIAKPNTTTWYFHPITADKIILELQSINSHKSTPKTCIPIESLKAASLLIQQWLY